jgi:dihydrolipoamide dehydrogenase
MAMRYVDVVVIGAGTAGLQAYHAAKDGAERVVLIESGPFGTTCARTGCMPSKAFIAAARAARNVRIAETFGVRAGEPGIDGAAVMRRVRGLRDDFVASVVDGMIDIPEENLIRSEASFVKPRVIAAGGETFAAGAIVLATGSYPFVPERIARALGPRVLTVDDLWEIETLPESVLLFGAGPLGAETGQALARLGVRVTCLSKGGKIGFLTDPEVTAEAKRSFESCMAIDLDARIDELGLTDDGVRVTYTAKGETRTESFETALAATGRRPNLAALGLERSGLELDDHGVPLFDPDTRACRGTGDVPVFIAGDVDDDDPVLPPARRNGALAGRNAASWPLTETPVRPDALFIAFTDPAMAQVGLSYEEAFRRSDFCVGSASFRDQGRARCEARNEGTIRLYGSRRTRRVVGAEMVCPGAEHLAHTLAWAMASKPSLDDLKEFPIYHPVLEEGLTTAIGNLQGQLDRG